MVSRIKPFPPSPAQRYQVLHPGTSEFYLIRKSIFADMIVKDLEMGGLSGR